MNNKIENRIEIDKVPDNKNRMHDITVATSRVYVDNYYADDDFDITELLNREDYTYYFDRYNHSLHKKNKDDNKFYEYIVRGENNTVYKDWLKINDFSTRDLAEINNYDKIIWYIDQTIKDIINDTDEMNIENLSIEDMA